MLSTKHDPDSSGRRRYPGARPFSDSTEDRQVFFGRDADIERLFERVLGTRLLVLFGKSGLGKSSLLMAGLFPRLRQKAFLPVPVRLGGSAPPASTVLSAIGEASRRCGAELTTGSDEGIWEFLRTSLIWRDDLLLTPVLVFDQFEEIFTLRDATFRNALALEIGALASGMPPDRLRGSDPRGAEPGARLGEQPPQVKILLSLREEYLGTLQELSGAIPGLFQERVRIAPLGEAEARLAISCPAARHAEPGDTPFVTPPFGFEPDALEEMLTFLKGESQIIEPFQLQLLCCRAEEIVAARAKGPAAADARPSERPDVVAGEASAAALPIQIGRVDLGGPSGMGSVLGKFYLRVIHMLAWRDRRRARRLCEEGLLSATGRRLMLDQMQIESEYGIGMRALSTLVDERLLRREQRLESLFYEISHDRLAESIERNRPFRIPRTLRHALRGATAVALVTIVLLLSWNRRIDQARVAADSARTDAEKLVAFLIGERLLEQLRPVGRNAVLEEVQGQVQAYLDHEPDQTRPEQLHNRGLALRNAGDILGSRGQLAQAIARFRDSARVFKRLATAAPENPGPRAELARSLYRLGDALLDQGRVSESLKTHREAWALRQALRQTVREGERASVDTTIDLADSNSSVARMLNHMGRPRQALVHLDVARDLLRPLAASPARSPRLLKALHEAIDNRAESLQLIGDTKGSSDEYKNALTITEEWVRRHPLSAEPRVRQFTAQSRVANDLMAEGAATVALDQYEQINRAVEELVRWDDTNASWKRDFAATLILIAQARAKKGQHSQALSEYAKALALLEDLAAIDSTNHNLKADIAWLYGSRGQLQRDRKQWARAAEDFMTSERYIVEAARADETYATWQRERYWQLFNLATARQEAGHRGEAAGSLRRVRDMASSLLARAPEATVVYQDLIWLYQNEVRLLKASGRAADAAVLAREQEQFVASALTSQPFSASLLNQAFEDELRAGNEAKAAGRLNQAVTSYRKGLERIARAATLEPGNVTWWDQLRYAHRTLADALYNGRRWAEAERAYRDAVAPGERAFALAPDRADLANGVFLVRLGLGDALRAQARQAQALAEFDRAGTWIDKAIRIDGRTAVYFDNRRALHVRVAQARMQLKDVEGALEAYRKGGEAGSRAVELAAGGDKTSFANNLYLLHVEVGDLHRSRDDAKAALQSYEAALPWIDKAIAFDSRRAVYFDNRRALHVRIAQARMRLKDVDGAFAAFRKGAEDGARAVDLGAGADKTRFAHNMFLLHQEVGNWQFDRNDNRAALHGYEAALPWIERAIAAAPGDSAYADNLGFLHLQVGWVKRAMKDTAGAEAAFRASVEVAESTARRHPDDASCHKRLSDSRLALGDLRLESGDAVVARAEFDAAERHGRRATELASKDGASWRALSFAQLRLAMSAERQGDAEECLRLLRDALSNAERASRLLPQDRTLIADVAEIKDAVGKRSR